MNTPKSSFLPVCIFIFSKLMVLKYIGNKLQVTYSILIVLFNITNETSVLQACKFLCLYSLHFFPFPSLKIQRLGSW